MGTSITRREFFCKSATGAAALAIPYIVPSTVFAANGRPAPSDRIVLAAIGLGGQGNGDLFSLIGIPGVHVVAVCDVDVARREKTKARVERFYAENQPNGNYAGCDTYNDFRELLARGDLDAVCIATPDHWHALIAIAAAKAGLDMYSQKPMSLTIGEGRAMVEAVQRHGRVFQTGSQQRSEANFRYACELVRNGRIGQLKTVEVGIPGGTQVDADKYPPAPVPKGFDYDTWLGPAPWKPYTQGSCHWNFRHNLDYSGGLITDWGAHHLDIAQWGIGAERSGPISVEGEGRYATEGIYNCAIDYRFVCTYENGVRLTCWSAYPQGVRFVGTEGWVYVRRGAIDAHQKSLLTSIIGPNEEHLPVSTGHYTNFIECVRSRQETLAPVDIGYRSVTVCHLGNIAMRLDRKVNWDPVAQNFGKDDEANRMIYRPMRQPWRL